MVDALEGKDRLLTQASIFKSVFITYLACAPPLQIRISLVLVT